MGWRDSFIHLSKELSENEIKALLTELGFGKVTQIGSAGAMEAMGLCAGSVHPCTLISDYGGFFGAGRYCDLGEGRRADNVWPHSVLATLQKWSNDCSVCISLFESGSESYALYAFEATNMVRSFVSTNGRLLLDKGSQLKGERVRLSTISVGRLEQSIFDILEKKFVTFERVDNTSLVLYRPATEPSREGLGLT